ncbi:hypothetical protein CALVIDRAFT_283840 [Calocera viscosa TUFC12733]|uniref:Zn(2)-C6 fungal-type domain-containing protein n=1 Tax=Calocera viscosa (strain TUFC12733) TaxID=1330018 RepID=A0A167R858_CALVF|nr:hypothetical protein CALVIDRAFT_283840 [Calocera viscosa TUFC12733]
MMDALPGPLGPSPFDTNGVPPFPFLPVPNHHIHHSPEQQLPLINGTSPPKGSKRKRTRNDEDRPEPRRLKRTYESCARCRSKKIKCDNNSPRCKNCADGNVDCQQEDRQNRTLKLRGHEELLQAQLNCCVLLLKHRDPYFDLTRLDQFIEDDKIQVSEEDADILRKNAQLLRGMNPSPRSRPIRDLPHRTAMQNEEMSPNESEETYAPTYNPAPPIATPSFAPPPFPFSDRTEFAGTRLAPTFEFPGLPPELVHGNPGDDLRGQDPRGNDLSNSAAAARSLRVDRILRESSFLIPHYARRMNDEDSPDLPDRGRTPYEGPEVPTDDPALMDDIVEDQWLSRPIQRPDRPGKSPTDKDKHKVFLPKNRTEVARLVDVYFQRLNHLRPVFSSRAWFDNKLREEYELIDRWNAFGTLVDTTAKPKPPPEKTKRRRRGKKDEEREDDPGFLCSVYLILALSRMADIASDRQEAKRSDMKHFPVPAHFFKRAVQSKAELRVTISSLQALILMQWYLYTERHGRTLWRLVGNLVRLAIELGLHHDPVDSGDTFDPDEIDDRRRLWWIVLVQDRGTSVLLGRPIGIGENDFNTKKPESELNFDIGLEITHIQAQICDTLYRPGKISGEELFKFANEINTKLVKMRDTLPPEYHFYTRDTENWGDQQKMVLLANLSQEQGLTLLKYMIARIMLLRAIFTAEDISEHQRMRALRDALISAHNVLVIHSAILQFIDCAFFVSPIPIQIAAMVVIYAKANTNFLTRPESPMPEHIAREDVCLALRMIPQFRWRWGRRDSHGGHPLMNFTSEAVFGPILHAFGPPNPPMLIAEHHFTEPDETIPFTSPTSPTSPAFSPIEALKNVQGYENRKAVLNIISSLFLGTTPSVAHPDALELDESLLNADWRHGRLAGFSQEKVSYLDEGTVNPDAAGSQDGFDLQLLLASAPIKSDGTSMIPNLRLNADWMPVQANADKVHETFATQSNGSVSSLS